jgi:hypothetical protein
MNLDPEVFEKLPTQVQSGQLAMARIWGMYTKASQDLGISEA